jgi:hypothetical protein
MSEQEKPVEIGKVKDAKGDVKFQIVVDAQSQQFVPVESKFHEDIQNTLKDPFQTKEYYLNWIRNNTKTRTAAFPSMPQDAWTIWFKDQDDAKKFWKAHCSRIETAVDPFTKQDQAKPPEVIWED